MNDPIERRVHAAAVAGWWTLLVGAIFLTVAWFTFIGLLKDPPAWFVAMWGDLSGNQISMAAIWLVGVFKVFLWLGALLTLWLTLWARQLRKSARGS